MAKLYPPTINENIPAFYKENGTVKITVPFSMNRAVLKNDIFGFILKIKTVQGNIQLGTKSIKDGLEQIIKDKKVIFSLEENNSDDETLIEKLRVGQFLKVQMAYLDKNNEVGYYSTVGITKYTSKPILSIQGFKTEEDEDYSINHFPTKIIGEYQLGEDKTERPYSYNFSLYDEKDQLLETSGWILYNNNINNTLNSLNTITTLPYYFRTVSEPNINYKINFQVRTINNLEISSPNYECMEINIEELLADDISTGTIKLEKFKFDLKAKNNFEEGYIKLGFKIDEKVLKQLEQDVRDLLKRSRDNELGIIKNQKEENAKYPSTYSGNNFFNGENFRYTITYNSLPSGGTAYHYNLYDGDTLKEGVSFYYDINDYLYYIKFVDKIDNLITHWENCGEYEIFPIEENSISFEICRASNKDNFLKWSVLQRVTFEDTVQAMDWSFKDVTVEQGVQYKYSFRQYNDNGLYSNREETESIMADFEDIFLCDNDKQIKIRFNPKISSFKTTRLESKMDTIGGKHPFIFRNGIVEYKEFPIQGLISYYLDENEEFLKDSYKELGITFGKKLERLGNSKDLKDNVNQQIKNLSTTNFENYNIKAEREFKLKLLDWLGNGEIKLFKSPSEGNYFVRLMNISLSPEDRLNRMIHNFSCQAYEVMDYNYDNLLNLNYYSLENEAVRYIGNIENIYIINIFNGDLTDNPNILDDETLSNKKIYSQNNQYLEITSFNKEDKQSLLLNLKKDIIIENDQNKIGLDHYYRRKKGSTDVWNPKYLQGSVSFNSYYEYCLGTKIILKCQSINIVYKKESD